MVLQGPRTPFSHRAAADQGLNHAELRTAHQNQLRVSASTHEAQPLSGVGHNSGYPVARRFIGAAFATIKRSGAKKIPGLFTSRVVSRELRRVKATRPNPTQPDQTRPDQTRPVRFRTLPDPTGLAPRHVGYFLTRLARRLVTGETAGKYLVLL